jgi:hypothetical protein
MPMRGHLRRRAALIERVRAWSPECSAIVSSFNINDLLCAVSDHAPRPSTCLGTRARDGPTSSAPLAVALVIAASVDLGDGFVLRVATIDALAGLTVAAFLVDRLLTFIPPPCRGERAFDLNLMRFGFGRSSRRRSSA